MGEKQWWCLCFTRVEDAIPERDVSLETASEAPPDILCLGSEDFPSHSHAFINAQGVYKNQTCFSDLLSGWELVTGTIAGLR